MASKNVGGNSLSLLLGDYNSDSENDDNESTNNQLNEKLEEFLTDLNTIVTTNWTQCIDQSTGHPYYWNTLTKDVTWEMPAEYEKFLQQNLRSKNSNKDNSYTVCYTDENVPYYVNEFTRQVVWEKPAGFVEPKAKLKENSNKLKRSKGSSAERNGYKKKSKKQEKSTKQYPYDANDDLDHVKIELISSFTAKSDSSSEEETKSKKAKGKFNLVANDYNSDDNSDNESKTTTTEKPLFASLSSTVAVDPSTVKIYSLKTDLPCNVTEKSNITDEIGANIVEKPATTKSKANTFASIITGGRNSPSDQDQELIELMKLEVTEAEPLPVQVDQPPEIDVKTFKRKRRIEFMTRPIAPVKSTNEVTVGSSTNDSNNSVATPERDTPNTDATKANDESSTKPQYSNFVRANVESSGEANKTNNDKLSESVANDELNKHKTEICELRTIIESKLKFLCNGRPDVSAVQAIFIQFETLLEAYDSQALQPAYIQRWLDGISSDLSTLENDAAPAGWKCLWNRKKSQYCYKNLTTGDIRWEYPENDSKTHDADEMDICTTPPPNVDEQLKLEQTKVNSRNGDENSTFAQPQHDEDGLLIPPPPPYISFVDDEPPPPGTDVDSRKDKPSEQINSELASFYSEMASIDTNSMPATELLPTSSTDTAKIPTENTATDAVLKKKKKKVKKSEPWRSGNLETWINKWQKAQKELDG